ncbi:hypothetical protein AA650_25260 [Anabaena sp. WA102]|uniref:hypothetical protein n=1 Tax=Anabaena sp. WA102 TaxID=1647413 RepID=UPI0006AC8F49|nr:hypothetical protein [Anabaena sp. WA102]ALB43320.1 hypothetical protein AA650_25260 [Anabaena sp. WA102]
MWGCDSEVLLQAVRFLGCGECDSEARPRNRFWGLGVRKRCAPQESLFGGMGMRSLFGMLGMRKRCAPQESLFGYVGMSDRV